MSAAKPSRRSLTEIFAAPLAIAFISAVGLVTALVGDDWWDRASWAALFVPVALYLYCLWRKDDGRRRR